MKTYAIRGVIEMRCQIPTGVRATPFLTIPFSGGQITGYGMAPARYATADLFEQYMIERSELFRSGRIEILPEEKKEGKKNGKAN